MAWTSFAERHVLNTRLSPAECHTRLSARAATWPCWRPTPEHPVAGSVSSAGFTLTKAISYRNSLQTEARGTFVSTEHGTRINLTLGPSPVVLVFGLIWLLFVLGFLVTGFSGGFPVADPGGLALAIPVGMLLVGVAITAVGSTLARGEGTFLLQFLQEALDADERPLETG